MTNFSSPTLQSRSLPSRQKGAVLLVGMALLIIITLFALAAIRGITLQERISGGLYDREIAFSAAESALRWAERQYMLNGSTSASQEFMARIYAANDDPALQSSDPVPNTEAFFADLDYENLSDKLIKLDGIKYSELKIDKFGSGSSGNAQSAHGAPAYMAVYLKEGGECGAAVRINTVGVGRNPNTLVVLESIVCMP